jgi:omega-hydroxy-beta-dihydromenaquinone-9 sulfotransferase
MSKIKEQYSYIFIIGNSRSGSTMLSSILAKDLNTMAFKELHYFDLISQPSKIFYSYDKAIEVYAKLLCVNKLEPWNIHRYKEFLLESKEQLIIKDEISNYELFTNYISNQLKLNNKKIAIEQTPRNANFFKLISENIPESKFIHIIRDPRDVLLSQKEKWKRNKLGGNMSRKEVIRTYFNHNPFITSYIYKKTLQNVSKQNINISSNRFFEIKFENILGEPMVHLKRLFNFVGLNFTNDVLYINHTSSSFVSNKKKGIDSTRKLAWKNKISNTEQVICQAINKKNIIQNNYELIRQTPNVFKFSYYLIALFFQLFFIVVLNYKILLKNLVSLFSQKK